MTFLWILCSTALVGLISLVGIVFFISQSDVKKLTFYFVSLASGTMLGTALLHMIPEAMALHARGTPYAIAAGIFGFFILEKLLVWQHCHSHHHEPRDSRHPTAARMVVVGDMVHNFLDGVIIASAFLADRAVGISVTTAIILHEIPQEVGDFGTLIHMGFSIKKALLVNVLTATTALLGATCAYFFIEAVPHLQLIMLPIAAGGLLYISLADLIPQLHDENALKQTWGQILLLAFGFGVMALFKE